MARTSRAFRAFNHLILALLGLWILGAAIQAEATSVKLGPNAAYSLTGSSVVLSVDSITNSSQSDSATVRLELWAWSEPCCVADTFGWKVGEYSVGQIPAGSSIVSVNSGMVPYVPPLAGTWYLTMMLTEFTGSPNYLFGDYALRDYFNFPTPVVLNGPVNNYQGLWWNPAESGWGINFAHQGNSVFATWYTYDTSGNAYWLSMLANSRNSISTNSYSGQIYVDTGPPFNSFNASGVPTLVGTGTVTFGDADNGTFTYFISAGGATNIQQTKAITRFSLGGAQPACTYSASPNLAAATNYQDLWWVPTESGWGANFAHQGDQLFATWYTYDATVSGNNAPLWLSALLQRQGTSNVFTGSLTRTSGPRFDNYKPPYASQTVGTLTATFTDGNHAAFHYITNGTGGLPAVDQTKSITRFLFAGPAGTVCQ